MPSKSSKLGDGPERRSLALSDFEFRANGDHLELDGLASVFDEPYDVLGGPPVGWSEVVDRRAFNATLAANPDLHLLINHEGMPLARTKSGTLLLSVDGRGLRVRAPGLDRRDPDVQRLEVKMARGDMDEMSFAFRVKGQEWSRDDSQRRLTEVSLHKGDVSIVNHGANPATSAELLRAVAELDPAEARRLDTADLTRARQRLAKIGRLAQYRDIVAHRAELGEELDAPEARAVDKGNIDTPDADDLNTAAREYAASKGSAMDGGSYPIRPLDMHGKTDLDKAINAVGRGDASHDKIRRHIMTRAEALGLTSMIPDNWQSDGSITDD